MSRHPHPGATRRRRATTTLAAAAALLGSVASVQLGTAPGATAAANGAALTPPMGWNTWNTFGCNISEKLIKETADAMAKPGGLKDAHYEYVIIDDCWFNPDRDASGKLQGDPVRFPSGMKALGDYLHGKGLKFGIYQVPTDLTCAQRSGYGKGTAGTGTGSQGHERTDAETFAEWGVDYLKYDWCKGTSDVEEQKQKFALMRDELARATAKFATDNGKAERRIVYSINPNSYFKQDAGATVDWSSIANLWRTTEDIKNAWRSGPDDTRYGLGALDITHVTGPLGAQTGPGHWNDPDMLEVGVTKDGRSLTPAEARSHMSLWAQMAAPLIAGNDIRAMMADPLTVSAEVAAANEDARKVLTNEKLISIDQDSLGKAARIVTDSATQVLTVRELAGGDRSVTLTNTADTTATVTTSAAELGIAGAPTYTVSDVWAPDGTPSTTTTGALSATLAPHATALYRITPNGTVSPDQAAPTTGTYDITSAASPSQVLDNSGSSSNGKQLITWERKRNANQEWILTANGDSSYSVKHKTTGKCLDIDNASKTAGAKVIQYTCNGQNNQKFTLTPDGADRYKLIAKHSGLAITPSGTTNGALLTQQAPAAAQSWSFIKTG
ncbi:ricin-type beta-trefoil lectin domain protein [Kitasatospora albolonga]|uniref:alpha-galactosidase n=1 Tax=Kitasatospora albolonga TaxID=68173 RepID=UPI0031E7F9C8